MKQILSKVLCAWRRRKSVQELPEAALAQMAVDRMGLPSVDPGLEATAGAAIAWLCEAQDRSLFADGGVARAYSLRTGWQSSYPETTGYIIPTLLNDALAFVHDAAGRENLRHRARRMVDWLVSIQMPSGAFQGGRIDSKPVVPVVFNTGQILMGLAAGEAAFGVYGSALRRAADWLVKVQDPDGCWRQFPTPFALAGEKAYDTHTAWGLLEAARIEPRRGYGEAALKNVRWAIAQQRSNGWIANCCLSDTSQPLTHTLGYALRGMLEAHRFSGDSLYLDAARRTADGLLEALHEDGYLPGKFRSDWSPAATWACLTGTVQTAYSWLMLFEHTGEPRYRDAAFAANRYVRRTMQLSAPAHVRGAVKGSFPIDGKYCQYEYPNWAAKFLIDALSFERDVRQGLRRAVA